MLTRHSSVSQTISWNWKHLIKRKCRLLTHHILCSYLRNALCKLFVKIESNFKVFPKYILKLKARDKSFQARKKLYCYVTVLYLCNVLWKFLTKIESAWRSEIQEQAPQLTLLWCGKTVRSSRRRFSIKMLFLKISQYPPTENTCAGFSF